MTIPVEAGKIIAGKIFFQRCHTVGGAGPSIGRAKLLALLFPSTYPRKFTAKGGCLMTLSETLQFCLVIIGICSLFIQLYNKK